MSDTGTHGIGSAAPGRYGPAGRDLAMFEATIAIAWNVQGNPSRTSIVADVERLFDVALPLEPNATRRNDTVAAFWLGPRSWLLLRDPSAASGAMGDFDAAREALNAGGGALFDVSRSRVAHTIRGREAPSVLARGCPLDLDPRAFAPGHCAQSLFGRIAALFYRHEADAAFTMMVARSMAADAWRGLCVAASAEGYDVGASRQFRAD